MATHTTAIILAAGRGARFKSSQSKPLVQIHGQPMCVYSLKALSRHPLINDIIVVVNRANRKGILEAAARYGINKICGVVYGGSRRQDSVKNALAALPCDTEYVAVHDAARPFITGAMVTAVIKEAQKSQAAIVGVPVKATIKKVTGSHSHKVTRNGIVCETLQRNQLWEIQTPQVFKKELLIKAYQKFGAADVTDDAALMEKLGVKVAVVMGTYTNIKITTPEDLQIAQAICHTVPA